MVKNAGGNKSKKVGRKFSAPQADKNIRLSESDMEIYASVTKLLGNGMFHAYDTDNKERLCIMRQKFKGRGKRDNTVSVGSWVLIGMRDWEGGSCSKPKCDLLEVYNEVEKAKLKKSGDPVFSKLRNDSDYVPGGAKDGDESFEFTNDDGFSTEEYKNLIKDIMNKKKTETDDMGDSVAPSTSPPLEKVSAGGSDHDNSSIVSDSYTSKKRRCNENTKDGKISIMVPVKTSTGSGGEKSFSLQEVDIDDI